MKTTVITDRPSQAGDELVLDYTGTIDGVAFEGGSAQNQTLVLGSGMFIPGFEEQLLGKSAGDQADVRVSFPANYHVSTLAGQPAVFHCTIRAIRVREKYCADDTFAREVFHLDSFSSLEKALRDQLQSYIDRKADEELKNDLLDQVCANARLSATDGTDCPRSRSRNEIAGRSARAPEVSRLRRTRSLREKPSSSCARITCRTRRRICSAST